MNNNSIFPVDDRNGSFDVMLTQSNNGDIVSPMVGTMMDKEMRLTMNGGVSDDPVLECSEDEYWNDDFPLKNPYDEEDEVSPYSPATYTNLKVPTDTSKITNSEESDVFPNEVTPIPYPHPSHASFLDVPTYQDNNMMNDCPINHANHVLKTSNEPIDNCNNTNFMDPGIFAPQSFTYSSYENPSNGRNRPSHTENPVHEYPILSHGGNFTSDESDLDTSMPKKKRARSSFLSEKEIIARREAQLRKNRDFAKLSRDRKKMYLQTLQLKIASLTSEYSNLVQKRDALIASTRHMQEKLIKLRHRRD